MICSCAPTFKIFSAPPDVASTEYQISNRKFSDFRIVNFLTCIARVVFSLLVMGNGPANKSCRYCSASKESLLSFLVPLSFCSCLCHCVWSDRCLNCVPGTPVLLYSAIFNSLSSVTCSCCSPVMTSYISYSNLYCDCCVTTSLRYYYYYYCCRRTFKCKTYAYNII